jgi:hypothetical protein
MATQTIQKLNELAEKYYYWDTDINKLEIKNLGKYFEFKYADKDENGKDCEIIYSFTDCYKIDFENDIDYDREYKRYCNHYSMQDIKFEEFKHENTVFLKFTMNAYPLTLEILCRNIEIKKVFL